MLGLVKVKELGSEDCVWVKLAYSKTWPRVKVGTVRQTSCWLTQKHDFVVRFSAVSAYFTSSHVRKFGGTFYFLPLFQPSLSIARGSELKGWLRQNRLDEGTGDGVSCCELRRITKSDIKSNTLFCINSIS